MTTSNKFFPLGWSTVVNNRVTIVGRPMSGVGFRTYDKSAVKAQLGAAADVAVEMVTETQNIVQSCFNAAMANAAGPSAHGTFEGQLRPGVQKTLEEHFQIVPLTPANATAYVDFFKHLAQVYQLIRSGLGGQLTLVDTAVGNGGCRGLVNSHGGYTLLDNVDGAAGPRTANRGRIHIDFPWTLTCSRYRVARTIIHEASHKFAGMRDHCYEWDRPDYTQLTDDKSRNNADSIACFAYFLWEKKIYTIKH